MPCPIDHAPIGVNGVMHGRRMNAQPGMKSESRQRMKEDVGPDVRDEATHHTQLGPPSSCPNKFSTVKLKPVWTAEYMRQQQLSICATREFAEDCITSTPQPHHG